MKENGFKFYTGDGKTIGERGLRLPLFQGVSELDDPSGYIASKGLSDAVNVALALGQPLLLTGEPGTGKTQLAASIAYELQLAKPLVFNTKTTSTARDLFYSYDALGHFHDAQFRKEELPLENYITYEALGLAILLAMNPAESAPFLPEHLRGAGPARSVVLIDEIDKAPRDLPNDILNEIEQLSFTVKETGRTFTVDQAYRPILVLTSNSEKNLPDAFLRRCVFYHIDFPDSEALKGIVERRLKLSGGFTPQMLDHAVQHFETIRELALKKKPATAELLSWIRVLERMQIDVKNLKPGEAEALAFTYSILAKSKEDKSIILQHLH
ncbi:MAG TPA: MoxR family ATPase [Pyrinomonadaceae bacterium]|jgi:MoxR-like ATPase|nr:MoxR family ATPase [Pyrinomonadaceae bacterium]